MRPNERPHISTHPTPTGGSWIARAARHLLRAGAAALALLLVACTVAEQLTPLGTMRDPAENTITASGFIEGREVNVAAETAGRIAEIAVDRSASVTAGDLLIRLDDGTLQSQRGEAEAALAGAEANLARVLAGSRPEEIAAARADLSEAEAQAAGAAQAVIDAREAITNPQSLDARIHEAQSQVALAEQGVEQAEAELAATQLKRDVYAEQGGDIKRTWDLQLDAAEAALKEAEAKLVGATATLAALYGVRTTPLQLQAELHGAETEADLAAAQVEARQARLAELTAGPTASEIALAEARVAQAEATLGVIDARLAQLTLTAPMDGVVSTRVAQVGETATAGQPLLTIANLDEVTLVIYIAQGEIGRVQIGQPVTVTVDAFPDRAFSGRVASIAGEAEFTPSNVQTSEERVNLVFAVDVDVPNPDHALKPGVPADAVIRP